MEKSGYGLAGGRCTEVLHSSTNYHQKHATQPCRLRKDVAAACGVILRFQGVLILHKVFVCMLISAYQMKVVGCDPSFINVTIVHAI